MNVLLGFAVCTTNGTILVDEQIVEHFDRHATGKEIKSQFPNAVWGKPLEVPSN